MKPDTRWIPQLSRHLRPCKKRPAYLTGHMFTRTCRDGYSLLPIRYIGAVFRLFRLTQSGREMKLLESERCPIIVRGVVVVHIAVVVDIHKVRGVTSVSTQSPPVVARRNNGFAENNRIRLTVRRKVRLYN